MRDTADGAVCGGQVSGITRGIKERLRFRRFALHHFR